MAYKKYIKRGGKVYGPYIYHSRRVDGKVISEYHGPGKPGYKLSYKKILLAVLGVVFLAVLIYLLLFSEKEMTGKAVVEFEREVEGQVSVGETFNYTLQEGERAELKPRSVETDSGQLSDSDIELKTEENKVIVTTTYSEINQSSPIVYFVLSILSEEKSVEENITEPEENITEPEPEIIEETEPEPEITEEPIKTEIYVPELVVSLTEQERAVLIEKFGDTLKVEETLRKEFINIRYELSPEYWVEFNYDIYLSREVFELFKEKDRTKWLKDVAKSLTEEPDIEESKEYQTSF